MDALKLMTFNVQMLPAAVAALQGVSDDAKERADAAADAILGLPADQQPDVIAFNEVFSEEGRDQLRARLSAWSHQVVRVDRPSIVWVPPEVRGVDDSGLMLLSKLPFHELPTGGVVYDHFFTNIVDADQLANKAVAIVRINKPVEGTTIAFTHLQASYDDANTEHRDVRTAQVGEIVEALKAVMGPDPTAWRNVILLGDLNIRGDRIIPTDLDAEWRTTFVKPGAVLENVLTDGWRSQMHPPSLDFDYDPGVTNINLKTGRQQRLDYQCFSLSGVPATGVAPHHMFIPLQNQSDHFALEAVIQRWSPHCTPADAFKLADIAAIPGNSGDPTHLRKVSVKFDDDEAFQWIYVGWEGTFTVYPSADLTLRMFLRDNFSGEITPADTLSVTDLPAEEALIVGRHHVRPKGLTFAGRLPFFIALQKRGDLGAAEVLVYEHRGETAETAIRLTPHTTTQSGFPSGQVLGTDDRCWFRADFQPTYAGKPRTETFTFANLTGHPLRVQVIDEAGQVLEEISGDQETLEAQVTVTGGEHRLFALRRASVSDTGFNCFWRSPVTYPCLVKPLGFFIDDESGVNRFGDDEIQLNVLVDGGSSLFSGGWDDADSGERWPGFAEALRTRLNTSLPGARRLPFVEDVTFSYIEEDMNAASWRSEWLSPLAAGDPDEVDRRLALAVPDAISDGRYTVYGRLSRFPE